jgi:hypothetical protein
MHSKSLSQGWCALFIGAGLASILAAGQPALLGQKSTPGPTREPVPDMAALARSAEQLRNHFKDDYARAQTDPAAKVALAARLLQAVQDNKEKPSDCFIKLREARDLAAHAADTITAFQAAEELARRFTVNLLDMKTDALAAAAPPTTSPETSKTLAEIALGLVQEAVDEDHFDVAVRLGKLAGAAAAKSKDQPLMDGVARRQREVLAMREAFTQLKPVVDRLEKDPENADANLAMGKYLGFVKGNWDKALYYLAQGSDPTLRLLAQRDLARPEDTRRQLQTGDAWWAIAEKTQGTAQVHLQQRAVTWYEQVVEQTRGLQRGRLEHRIASVPPPFAARIAWDYTGRPGELRLFNGHTSTVYSVTFAPDGKKVLSGSVDGRAILWEAATGKHLQMLQGHGGMIWGVAYDPRGKHVFTSSWDGTVKMWDPVRGTEIRRFPVQGRIADINGMAVSANGKQLLTGSDDGTLRLWDVETGQELRQFHGHRGFVYGVAFSPDGKRALSGGSADNQLILWDLQTGKELRRFTGLQGQLRTVAFSADGRKAVHAGANEVRLWDLQTGQLVRQFMGHTQMVYAVAFSPDGRRLASAGADRTIRLWDVASGREVHRFEGHTSGIFALAFSPGGGRLVSGGQDNTVRLWGLPR